MENKTKTPAPNSIIDVVISNQHPNIQSFGLDIVGGVDRPYLQGETGIFISAVKDGGLAKKCGLLEVGDQILEINGSKVIDANHDDVVQLFVADRTRVALQVQKNKLQLLKTAAASPPVSPPSTNTPRPTAARQQQDNSGVSVSGFVIGIALGCVSVFLLRRYMTSGKS